MTITPNELRLGNWVKWPDEKEPNEVQWSHGHWLGVFEKNYGYPEGIELTPEWLERFGYEKLSNYEEGYMDEDYIWQHTEDKSPSLIIVKGVFHDDNYGSKIQFVHQIQNWFHCTTGRELELKK